MRYSPIIFVVMLICAIMGLGVLIGINGPWRADSGDLNAIYKTAYEEGVKVGQLEVLGYCANELKRGSYDV